MAWVDGSKIIFQHPAGSSLLNETAYVRMPTTRTANVNDVMNVPDDVLESVFINVVTKLKDRMGIPKDIIKDDLPAGNKGS
jgi:hypothetical protein